MSGDPKNTSNDQINQYEKIMVASREARRLNDHYRHRGLEPKTRVTTEAIDRVFVEGVNYAFGEDEPAPAEPEAPVSPLGGETPPAEG